MSSNGLLTGNLQQFPAVVAQSVHLGPKMALFYSRTRKTAGFWAHGRGFSRRLIACCALVAGKLRKVTSNSVRQFLVVEHSGDCLDQLAAAINSP
ncbi:hypothetical protein T07_12618 [Trichinella nelsoni]|uniref:Uncharacterized protein n=1 Tax=Trichinella nelsoni TaxID=6336 RepID=A0A0V0RWF6_9BILA|nr:hypothetical protein T07_12618 [Trichinella nelsoni]